jgi:hypothetical protein
MNEDMPWVNLTQEEVIDLRNKKFELTQYGKEKLRKLMNNKPIQAKVSTEDYNKVMNAINQKDLTLDEMIDEAARRERSNRILQRYNDFYNLECSGLSHGTPITPEFQQAMALECMLDALRCENLNHEFDMVPTADIEDLIERLYQQGKDYLNIVKEFKDSADGVA